MSRKELPQDYRTNHAWQKLDDLAVSVYRATAKFPDVERYGLISQLRRAAVSASANVAEGSGRGTVPDYLHFLYIARASLGEVEYYLHLSMRLGYLSESRDKALFALREEAGRTLHGLIAYWEKQRE